MSEYYKDAEKQGREATERIAEQARKMGMAARIDRVTWYAHNIRLALNPADLFDPRSCAQITVCTEQTGTSPAPRVYVTGFANGWKYRHARVTNLRPANLQPYLERIHARLLTAARDRAFKAEYNQRHEELVREALLLVPAEWHPRIAFKDTYQRTLQMTYTDATRGAKATVEVPVEPRGSLASRVACTVRLFIDAINTSI